MLIPESYLRKFGCAVALLGLAILPGCSMVDAVPDLLDHAGVFASAAPVQEPARNWPAPVPGAAPIQPINFMVTPPPQRSETEMTAASAKPLPAPQAAPSPTPQPRLLAAKSGGWITSEPRLPSAQSGGWLESGPRVPSAESGSWLESGPRVPSPESGSLIEAP